jgi:dolichol-phosphate mannosyltransferase
LPELTRRIAAALTPLAVVYEIILVNDGSVDESWVVIQNLASAHPQVVGINLSRNFGQQAAVKAGLTYATGDKIVQMDADLEDYPEHIPLMLDAMALGIDVVYTTLGRGRQRRSSGIFHRLAGSIIRSKLPETIGTLRLFSRKFADALLQFSERRPVWGPLMHGMGFRHTVVDLPEHAERQASGYTALKRIRLALDFLVANTAIPFMLVFLASLVLFVGTFIYSAVILVQYLFFQSTAPSGVALIVFVTLVLFGFNFFFISIIGLYINRILQEVLGRPVFVVDQVINSRRFVLTDKGVGNA